MEALSLNSIRRGEFDMDNTTVPTYLEFDRQIRALWLAANPHRESEESYRALGEMRLRRQWLAYIIGRYDRGARVPDRVWRMLTAGQRDAFLDSLRAQLGRITAHSETPNSAPKIPLDKRGDPRVHARRSS